MSVDAAYDEVLRITRREAKNFAYGIMVLPKLKRRAIAAVYAFAREVDDVADGTLPPDEKRARLEALRARLDGGELVALGDARERFGSPALDRPSEELRALLRFESERAAALLRAGDLLRARIGGRLGRAVGLFARGGLAALEALEHANWDVFTQRPKPSRVRLAREAALVLVK